MQAIKGMKDILDDEAILYEKIIESASFVAKNYGYSYINTPHLELTALFRRSVGESSDIVGKEMYEFVDKGGNEVCLRPEGTAGVVRAFIEHKIDRTDTIKRWFYHGSMFRYERPQKGRFREFHQFGVECFNVKSVYEDAAIISMASDILKKLDIKATLKLNSLGDKESMSRYREKLVEFLDKIPLCSDCQRRKELNPIRVLDCKNDECQKELKNAPLLIDYLSDECKREFDKLQELLTKNGIKFTIDPKLVRGLDYYCKSAFEFVSDELGAQSAVIGGGRYDRLVEYLGGRASYGVGFAMGVERIMEILSNKEQSSKREGIYLCLLDEKYLDMAFEIAKKLRAKFSLELCYEAKNLQRHLRTASNQNKKLFLCIGENEAKNGEIWFKNLQTRSEKMIKLEKLFEELADE
ncbi:histidine--tRNA ligase [uncultured Campylobacter sp.]|uniref:histidine--tRNA ligase n=1 Tax=uncultured Campylobacter sp. TaxID=218934 RepID=UPI00261B712B|nr:histidine--tRNA ligase [uncultured Campylobacter sp.]